MVGEKVPVDMRDRKPEASGRIQTKPGHELGWGGSLDGEREKRRRERGTSRPRGQEQARRQRDRVSKMAKLFRGQNLGKGK